MNKIKFSVRTKALILLFLHKVIKEEEKKSHDCVADQYKS